MKIAGRTNYFAMLLYSIFSFIRIPFSYCLFDFVQAFIFILSKCTPTVCFSYALYFISFLCLVLSITFFQSLDCDHAGVQS